MRVLRSVRRSAALCCLVWIGSVGSASAATPVFVDGAGVCAGLTPCFTTIQAGVNNAGPPPAVVSVFPGTYAESVELGTMGSAIGGMAGDLTLRTVNSSGVPTPGTASILPATGAAISNMLANFPGNITIEGFTLKSPDADGINLTTVVGDLTLRDVVCDGNAKSGVVGVINGGDLRFERSSFSGNLGGTGLALNTAVDVTFDAVTVDGNKSSGASIVLTGALRVTNSSFSNNLNGTGMVFSTATDVTLTGVTADGNNSSGASIVLTGALRVTNSSFSGNLNGTGMVFSTATDVTLTGVTADGNNSSGASIVLTGALRVTNSSFSNNLNGTGMVFSTATDVTLTGVTADGNNSSGASIVLTGALRVSNSSFSGNLNGTGMVFSTATDVVFAGVTADRNKSNGASIVLTGSLQAVESSFSNNMGTGFVFSTATTATLAGVTVSGNAVNGLDAFLSGAEITASHFERNGMTGVVLSPGGPVLPIRLTCNDIAGNKSGLALNTNVIVNAAKNFWGAASGPTHPSNPGGTGDSIVDGTNGGAGTVLFTPFLTQPEDESLSCRGVGAPAASAPGLALLLLVLFALPAWRLMRRSGADRR